MPRFAVVILALASVALAGRAFAENPQRTTATYGDWIVRCAMTAAAKTCEMTQSTELKGRSQPVTEIAIGRPANNTPLKIVFQVPVNAWLPPGVTLHAADGHAEVAASFDHCIPAGCFAEGDIKGSVIVALRAAKKSGILTFKDANRHDVKIPVSFNGFGDAYDAMSKRS